MNVVRTDDKNYLLYKEQRVESTYTFKVTIHGFRSRTICSHRLFFLCLRWSWQRSWVGWQHLLQSQSTSQKPEISEGPLEQTSCLLSLPLPVEWDLSPPPLSPGLYRQSWNTAQSLIGVDWWPGGTEKFLEISKLSTYIFFFHFGTTIYYFCMVKNTHFDLKWFNYIVPLCGLLLFHCRLMHFERKNIVKSITLSWIS